MLRNREKQSVRARTRERARDHPADYSSPQKTEETGRPPVGHVVQPAAAVAGLAAAVATALRSPLRLRGLFAI